MLALPAFNTDSRKVVFLPKKISQVAQVYCNINNRAIHRHFNFLTNYHKSRVLIHLVLYVVVI